MYRNTYVDIDLDILKDNVKKITTKYNNYKYYIGVVKGNCYGHGSYSVNALIDGGVNYLAVSSLEEGIDIRKYNKDISILCLEPIDIKYIDVIIKNNITITIDSLSYYKELIETNFKGKIKFHLKLDTGMNRLGLKSKKDVDYIVNDSCNHNSIILEGIYTHMATSGVNDKHYDDQVNRFIYLTSDIDLSKIPIVHMGRSISLVQHKKLNFVNGVRLGIIMFGFNNNMSFGTGIKGCIRRLRHKKNVKKLNISPTYLTNDLKLKTAFKLYSEVISLRKVRKGEFVGYGANYIANDDIMVATIPIGYADGIDKKMGQVCINSKRYEIIGDICMDMTTVMVDESVHIHDKVEIFGNNIKISEVVRRLGINSYRLFLSITNRVTRKYNDNTEIKY